MSSLNYYYKSNHIPDDYDVHGGDVDRQAPPVHKPRHVWWGEKQTN